MEGYGDIHPQSREGHLQSQHPNKGLEDLCDELKRRLLRSPRLSLLGIYGSGSWISEVIWMLRSPTCHHRTVSDGSSMSTRRSRAAIACEKCRQRKVRCSITLTGVPCISCTQDGSVCAVRHTKFNKYVDQRTTQIPLTKVSCSKCASNIDSPALKHRRRISQWNAVCTTIELRSGREHHNSIAN